MFFLKVYLPWPPSQHPERLLSAPAAGRRLAAAPDTPWSADGNAAASPRWRDPCSTRTHTQVRGPAVAERVFNQSRTL